MPILMLKYNVDSIFICIFLYFVLAVKIIITYSALVFIFLITIFREKTLYSHFNLLAEPIANLVNKILSSNSLSELHATSNYV